MRRHQLLAAVVRLLALLLGGLAVIAAVVQAPSASSLEAHVALSAPPGWTAMSGVQEGRYEQRWIATQNGGVDPEAISPTSRYRTYSPWKGVASDRVVVRVSALSGPLGAISPTGPDAAFPLDWSRAERFDSDWDFEVWQLTFWAGGTRYLATAHIGSSASAVDRLAVRAVIATVRTTR
jgi:hypothetical protein